MHGMTANARNCVMRTYYFSLNFFLPAIWQKSQRPGDVTVRTLLLRLRHNVFTSRVKTTGLNRTTTPRTRRVTDLTSGPATLKVKGERPARRSLPARLQTLRSIGSNQPKYRLELTPGLPLGDTLQVWQDILASVKRHADFPVGGRLRWFWKDWQVLGASRTVVKWLRNGYPLPIRKNSFGREIPVPLRQSVPPDMRTAYPLGSEKAAVLDDMIQELLQKGAIREAPPTPSSRGLFQSRLPHSKEIGRMAIDNRSFSLKRVPEYQNVRNGHGRTYTGDPGDRHVGYVDRSFGRVLTHTDCRKVLEIPMLRGKRQDLSIRSSTLRASPSTLCVFQSDESAKCVGSSERNDYISVPGRLVLSACAEGPGGQSNAGGSTQSSGSRIDSKFSKIRSRPEPNGHIPRRKVGLKEVPRLSDGGEDDQDTLERGKSAGRLPSTRVSIRELIRPISGHREDCPSGKTPLTQSSETGKGGRPTGTDVPKSLTVIGQYSSGTPVVGKKGHPPNGLPFSSSKTPGNSADRCINVRLGCALQRQADNRFVV